MTSKNFPVITVCEFISGHQFLPNESDLGRPLNGILSYYEKSFEEMVDTRHELARFLTGIEWDNETIYEEAFAICKPYLNNQFPILTEYMNDNNFFIMEDNECVRVRYGLIYGIFDAWSFYLNVKEEPELVKKYVKN